MQRRSRVYSAFHVAHVGYIWRESPLLGVGVKAFDSERKGRRSFCTANSTPSKLNETRLMGQFFFLHINVSDEIKLNSV